MPYRYCPLCGTAFTRHVPEGEHRERLVCPDCKHIHYINPKPTVKGFVRRDDTVLMVRRAEAPGIGGWDIPGGYLEWDEHPETGLIREIHEETGVTAKITELLGAYHRVWRDGVATSSILNLCYVCDWISGEPEVRQPKEIDRVAWCPPGSPPDWVAFGHWEQALKDFHTRRR